MIQALARYNNQAGSSNTCACPPSATNTAADPTTTVIQPPGTSGGCPCTSSDTSNQSAQNSTSTTPQSTDPYAQQFQALSTDLKPITGKPGANTIAAQIQGTSSGGGAAMGSSIGGSPFGNALAGNMGMGSANMNSSGSGFSGGSSSVAAPSGVQAIGIPAQVPGQAMTALQMTGPSQAGSAGSDLQSFLDLLPQKPVEESSGGMMRAIATPYSRGIASIRIPPTNPTAPVLPAPLRAVMNTNRVVRGYDRSMAKHLGQTLRNMRL